MGLTIRGRKTDKAIFWSYSTLHGIRDLALICCGAPEFLDEGHQLLMTNFNSYPQVPEGVILDRHKVDWYILAVQKSGFHFPNITMHADHAGKYTKRGRVLVNDDLETRNSVQLLKELKLLLSQKECKLPKFKRQVGLTKTFYALVKDEVENGAGTILFS